MDNTLLQSWATPIIRSHKIFPNQLDLQKLCDNSTETIDNKTGNILAGKVIFNMPELIDVKAWIKEIAVQHISKINDWKQDYKVLFWDMWAWSSSNYDNPYHGHFNSSWGGVYCVDSGDENFTNNNGSTLLYSPLPWGTYVDPGVEFLEKKCRQWHNLTTGDLLLFPFYIKHSAKYTGSKKRSVIGFSLNFE